MHMLISIKVIIKADSLSRDGYSETRVFSVPWYAVCGRNEHAVITSAWKLNWTRYVYFNMENKVWFAFSTYVNANHETESYRSISTAEKHLEGQGHIHGRKS